ncbi:MAG: MaoC family dehydratase [Candidatus Pelagadaptatus aseana]|uniref:MaoC/PaaZ C-terminal domain-containing protein n=1 Tax=Candidatus Pelagadaptatus aseana TaxID=3120508 RepID=UPI0039B2CB6A
MNSKRYFEDFCVGESFTFGSYKMSEAEIIRFAKQYDPQPFHTDPEAAKDSPMGHFCASGLHTMSVVQRLNVEGLYNHIHLIAGRGIDNLNLLKPVVSNDVITAKMDITGLKAYPRLKRGLVQARSLAVNQNGQMVVKMDVEYLVSMRD